ncbi:tetratricopeptide repeat-containing glycosyltransferase family 2 protein [Paenibacillus vini]|uniref:Glycosyl transferase family 2 n=1 Tax=Paenibacillus vini TaxID=1476024 RepID=A0ABQ4M6I1_9BACL|nr:glycosyltransferase [Paenibacillus vini]GIP51609.1 glycosyl transferase family 2 [Paenibacillus vini]
MKRLSVCMIVKDEEELLPRCLDSLKGLADEIVIVDTGSIDRTKEIAGQYTDLIFNYTWIDDFAAARNESLRHATGKWILVMDADEYLSAEDYPKWNEFLDNEQPVHHLAYTLPIINFTGDKEYQDEITTSPVTRLFPNYKGIHFERPIHEQLTLGSEGELFHKKLDLNIYHTGYQNQRVSEKNKHERNMLIFNQMKSQSKMSEYDWFTLGNQYRYAKDEQQALECYEKALKGASSKVVWYPHCLVGLITLYYKQNQLHESWQWTESKLSKYKEYSEYYSIKGVHYETLGFFEEAIACYTTAIEIAETRARKNQEIWLVDPMYSFDMPVQQLIEIYFRMNNNQQAIYWLSKMLNKNNKNPRILLKLAEWLSFNDTPESVHHLLNQIYDQKNDTEMLLLYKVALALGKKELIKAYSPFMRDEKQYTNSDQVRLAVIQQNKEKWESYTSLSFQKDEDSQLYRWVQTLLGALIWGDCQPLEKIERLLENGQLSGLNDLMIQFISKDCIPEDRLVLENYSHELFLISKQLFILEQYELFDKFVKIFETSSLVNQLANYFYSVNLLDLAMNYYSILLSRQELDFNSLENLGFYHAVQNFEEEAVEFMTAAIQKEPGARHLYRFLIQYSKPENKTYYVERFKEEFPQFSSISFVKQFIDEKIIT